MSHKLSLPGGTIIDDKYGEWSLHVGPFGLRIKMDHFNRIENWWDQSGCKSG